MVEYSILIIEDNIGDFELVELYLKEIEDTKIILSHVETVKAACEKLATNLYDLILSDLNLPDSNAAATVASITQAAKDSPLVFLTGLSDRKFGIEAIKAGAQDYIVKEDINTRLLDKTIQYAIERNKSKVLIEAMAIKDDLTGLYNRAGLKILLSKMVEVAIRHKKGVGVLLLDIDDFKSINDNYGHVEGDIALKELANILTQTFRTSDIIARLGGDEFLTVFLCEEQCQNGEILKRLQTHLDNFNQLNQYKWKLRFSKGVARYLPEELDEFDSMIHKVDKLMYKDKSNKTLR